MIGWAPIGGGDIIILVFLLVGLWIAIVDEF